MPPFKNPCDVHLKPVISAKWFNSKKQKALSDVNPKHNRHCAPQLFCSVRTKNCMSKQEVFKAYLEIGFG
jgi:hypothetical protein